MLDEDARFLEGTGVEEELGLAVSHRVLADVRAYGDLVAAVLEESRSRTIGWVRQRFGRVADASLPFFFTVVHETGWFARFLRTRALLHLGTISYSLYLVHPFVLDAARTAVRHLAPRLQSDALAMALFTILGVGGAIVAASVLYRWVEVGVTRRLRGQPSATAVGGRRAALQAVR